MWRELLRLIPWNLQPVNELKCNLWHTLWLRWKMSAIQHGLCWASNWKQRLMFVYVGPSHDQVSRKLKLYETLQWLFIVSAGKLIISQWICVFDYLNLHGSTTVSCLDVYVACPLLVRCVLPLRVDHSHNWEWPILCFCRRCIPYLQQFCNTGIPTVSAAGRTASFGSCSRTRLCLRWQLPRGELLKYLQLEFSVKDFAPIQTQHPWKLT